MVLHGYEPRPAVQICRVLGLRELPREHARRSDVARLAGSNNIVQSLHRFLNRRSVIPSMDLKQVDVLHSEPTKRIVYTIHDVLPRQSERIRVVWIHL